MEHPLHIVQTHKTVLVSINELESLANLRLLDECPSVSTSCYEVLKINLTITVNITSLNDQVPIERVFGSILPAKLGLGDASDILF